MAEGLTKKQLKELKKLEKMQSKNIEQKNNSVKWIAISIVSLLFLALFVGVVLVAKDKNKPKTEDGQIAVAQNGHERMVNSTTTDATNSSEIAQKQVVIVEYADLQCPACKMYHPIVKELLAAYPDQVKLIFKNFPLISIHPNAMAAAVAAEAAGKQNKYFEYVDLLYEKQEEWSPLPNPSKKFEDYAKALGLDVVVFVEDTKDPAIKSLIEEHRTEGINNGVSGTPTFFVAGVKVENPGDLEGFKKLIESELQKQTQATTAPEPTTDPGQLQLQE